MTLEVNKKTKKNKKGANSLITKKNNTKRKKERKKEIRKGGKGKIQPSTSNYRKIEVEIIK